MRATTSPTLIEMIRQKDSRVSSGSGSLPQVMKACQSLRKPARLEFSPHVGG